MWYFKTSFTVLVITISIISNFKYNCEASILNFGSVGLGINSILEKLSDFDPRTLFERRLNPDITLSAPGLITKYGYSVESHEITTQDGYILTVHRIPQGRDPSIIAGNSSENGRPIVFLQHGLMSSSDDWIINSPNKCLAFRLADEGYDVWIANSRGNRYSRKHRDLSPKRTQFWNFGFHEMGLYDIPASIDFALNRTEQSGVFYIGHNLGAAEILVTLSMRPDFNQKIRHISLMAPTVFGNNMRSPLRFLAPFTFLESIILDAVGNGELIPMFLIDILNFIAPSICTPQLFAASICESPLFLLAGFNAGQANHTQLPVILGHRTTTSSRTFIHFIQSINSPTFRQYDYGVKRNKRFYGGESLPPDYNLKNITAPVAIYWGENDLLADPKDVARLGSELNNVVVNERIAYRNWNHIDFLFGIDADKLVYNPVIENMEKYLNPL